MNGKKFAKYYDKNKEVVKITQQRYYYNKLSPEKKITFKNKLMQNNRFLKPTQRHQ